MTKLWLTACILIMWELAVLVECSSSSSPMSAPKSSPAPAPTHHSGGDNSDNCDALIYKMVECVPYLGNSGDQQKPQSSCCSGFKKIMKVNKKCLCSALKSTIDLGIKLNITRVKTLPSTCSVSTHLPKCPKVDSNDHHPPPASPKNAPTPSKHGPATSPPPVPETPAPAPVGSTASTITNSVCLSVSSWIISCLIYLMVY